jgi:hypothetical protein
MLSIDCHSEECISSLLVDDVYFEEHEKENRTLFFLGDSDANKVILNNAEFFKDSEMELLLGNYFYVKYESDLEKIFNTLHEAEEYTDLICSSSRVVTASFQTALEASVAGAEVVFIEIEELAREKREILNTLKVILIIKFNKVEYEQALLKNVSRASNVIERNETIIKKIIDRL